MFILTHLRKFLPALARDDSGAVATEYAFLVAFIAIVAALGMVLLGENLSTFFTNIGIALGNAGTSLPSIPGT